MDYFYDEYCSNCRKNVPIVIDYIEGNVICKVCGLVTERVIDQTAEYRKFASENDSCGVNRERIGATRDNSRADGGLVLSVTSSSSRRTAVQTMSTRLGPETEDLSRIKGMKMIRKWGELLSLKEPTLKRAEEEFIKIEGKKKDFRGRNFESMMAGLLYITTKICSIELKPHDIEDTTGVAFKEIKKAYNDLKEYVGPIAPFDGPSWCSNVCKKMELPRELRDVALNIAKDIKEKGHLDGKNPRTIASLAIYTATVKLSVQKNHPLSMIVTHAEISESTIKRYYKEISSKYLN